jgi:hypothetical protein
LYPLQSPINAFEKGTHMYINKARKAKAHTITGFIALASALAVVGGAAQADLVYQLEALEGEFAGSHITGTITLSDAMAGMTTWNIGMAMSFEFSSDFGPGYTWTTPDLIVSNDIAFVGSIGDLVLTPTHIGGEPGYAPDWRFDTVPHTIPGSISLGIGADNGGPLWNLVELGAKGNLDFRSTPVPGAGPQWQLILVPSPASSFLLLSAGILVTVNRRR